MFWELRIIQTCQKILRRKFPKNRSKIEIRLLVFLTLLLIPCITGDCCKVWALNNSTGWQHWTPPFNLTNVLYIIRWCTCGVLISLSPCKNILLEIFGFETFLSIPEICGLNDKRCKLCFLLKERIKHYILCWNDDVKFTDQLGRHTFTTNVNLRFKIFSN